MLLDIIRLYFLSDYSFLVLWHHFYDYCSTQCLTRSCHCEQCKVHLVTLWLLLVHWLALCIHWARRMHACSRCIVEYYSDCSRPLLCRVIGLVGRVTALADTFQRFFTGNYRFLEFLIPELGYLFNNRVLESTHVPYSPRMLNSVLIVFLACKLVIAGLNAS